MLPFMFMFHSSNLHSNETGNNKVILDKMGKGRLDKYSYTLEMLYTGSNKWFFKSSNNIAFIWLFKVLRSFTWQEFYFYQNIGWVIRCFLLIISYINSLESEAYKNFGWKKDELNLITEV